MTSCTFTSHQEWAPSLRNTSYTCDIPHAHVHTPLQNTFITQRRGVALNLMTLAFNRGRKRTWVKQWEFIKANQQPVCSDNEKIMEILSSERVYAPLQLDTFLITHRNRDTSLGHNNLLYKCQIIKSYTLLQMRFGLNIIFSNSTHTHTSTQHQHNMPRWRLSDVKSSLF